MDGPCVSPSCSCKVPSTWFPPHLPTAATLEGSLTARVVERRGHLNGSDPSGQQKVLLLLDPIEYNQYSPDLISGSCFKSTFHYKLEMWFAFGLSHSLCGREETEVGVKREREGWGCPWYALSDHFPNLLKVWFHCAQVLERAIIATTSRQIKWKHWHRKAEGEADRNGIVPQRAKQIVSPTEGLE